MEHHAGPELLSASSTIDRNFRSLNALLEVADVVTLHVPEAPETVKMIGEQELAKMRAGAALINASRGTVVDIDEGFDAQRLDRLKAIEGTLRARIVSR